MGDEEGDDRVGRDDNDDEAEEDGEAKRLPVETMRRRTYFTLSCATKEQQ